MKIDTQELFNNFMKEEALFSTQSEELETLRDINPEKETSEVVYYDEEVLYETLAKDFSYQIRERGEEYYYDGSIQQVYKNKNKYIAKVNGSFDKAYDVSITVTGENTALYECSCPCTYPCKHQYAVIMAISNLEYSEVELKTPVKEKEINLKAIIQEIPAEEIKNYLLSPKGLDNIKIEMETFSEYFRKYYPKQKYEFYYNNLYNDLVLGHDYFEKIDLYIDRARQYLSGNDFDEVFKIVKSIIEAYNDSNKLNFDNYVFEVINKLGMILRITYRKATEKTKVDIKEWTDKLEEQVYYNNYYLEDLILNLK